MLNDANYFSGESQQAYMSASQFKAFRKCEAAALAELRGEYHPETTTALMVGSYVDAWYDGALEDFCARHPEIVKRDGTLKSEYMQADRIIQRINRDPMFCEYMAGEKQRIMTGEIDGVPYKIKMDSYTPDVRIVDLKVVRDFKSIWTPLSGRITFIEAWGYDIQGAIYQAIEGNGLPFYIAAVTKEREPDIAIIEIPQRQLDAAMEVVRNESGHIALVKRGIIPPIRCEHCDYCKATKVLDRVISADELDGDTMEGFE